MKEVSEMKKGLVVLCVIVMAWAFGTSGVVDGQPRRLLVDHGCSLGARTFGIKFADGSDEFVASYLWVSLGDSAVDNCTLQIFYNGSSIGRTGNVGLVRNPGQEYNSPYGMFWLADSFYAAKNNAADVLCWEASTQ